MSVFIFLTSLILLAVFSYGYIDPHLSAQIPYIAYYHRPLATVTFLTIVIVLFWLYLYFLKHIPKLWVICAATVILVFSYPALSYDLFNYITTAKVLYTHHENPYIVMPIEIPNEPNVTFTRAANKVALYGPVWLALTDIPHALGGGNIWRTIFTFKLMNAAVYLAFGYFVWKTTRDKTNVIFFLLNPLVLIEVLMNGHNDIYMMLMALAGGSLGLIASWLVKGATLPLLLVRNKPLTWSYWILAGVFFVLAPLREELYPWYAVWLVTTASLLPFKSNKFIFWFTIVLTFALELRNLPYMWMGYYEGPGPVLRLLLTVVPLGIFGAVYFLKNSRKISV